MNKWIMQIDVGKCTNCRNCFLAIKDEYVGNTFPGYSKPQKPHGQPWLDIRTVERGSFPRVDVTYVPYSCMNCRDAPCIEKSPDGAVYRREDGIVMIDPEKARGKREIVDSCPYGVIFWNEEENVPQKWCFDAHLLDNGWTRTRADQACPTGALKLSKLDEKEISELDDDEEWETIEPHLGTKPGVYYKNYYRVTKCFIAGCVATRREGCEDCVPDARVTLTQEGAKVAETMTDIFGEFKFDKLEPGSGTYVLKARHETLGAASCEVALPGSDSVDIGVLSLDDANDIRDGAEH